MRKLTGAFAAFLYTTSAIGATLLPNGQQQFVDATGKPYANGKVYFYTNTPTCTIPKNTYQNEAATILNTNPVILDSAGRATIFGTGAYCQVLKDANGATIWTKYTSDTSSASNLGWGGTGGGTANVQTVSVSGFNNTNGQTFYYIPIATNTGATTLQVTGYAAAAVVKTTDTGLTALTGGEIVAGNVTGVTYVAGTGQFQLITNNNTATGYIGEVRTFAYTGCPAGWLAADGSAVPVSTYGALASVLGSTWGVSAGNVVLPALQNQFLRGSGSSPVGTTELNQFASHTHTPTVTNPPHSHTYDKPFAGATSVQLVGSVVSTPTVGGGTTSSDVQNTTVSIANTGATSPAETRPDNKRVQFCIKY